jgi:hypothetical protein
VFLLVDKNTRLLVQGTAVLEIRERASGPTRERTQILLPLDAIEDRRGLKLFLFDGI